jgi:hypothetical protein
MCLNPDCQTLYCPGCVLWICPICQHQNTEYYPLPAFPLCDQCSETFDRDVVL